MDGMGKKKPRPRRSFTSEFKAEIVELCRRGDRSVGQVAKDFDLTETAVRDWVRQAEVNVGERDGLTMLRTAATRGLDPDRISFTETLRSARRSVTVTPGSFSP